MDSETDKEKSGEETKTKRIRLFGTHEAAAVAASNLEAHGIKCWVDSDDCAGVYHNLTMAAGVSLSVLASDVEAADALLLTEATPEEIKQIEAAAITSPPPKGVILKKVAWGHIIIGVILGIFICQLYPWANELGNRYYYHYTSDRKADKMWTYRDGHLMEYNEDLNHDGKWDKWGYYDGRENLIRAEDDNNFDGKPDEFWHYANGQLIKSERDLDFNGTPDEFCIYSNEIIQQADIKPNGASYSTRREFYKNGVLTEEWQGGDRYGNFKKIVQYDPFSEPVSTNMFDLLKTNGP